MKDSISDGAIILWEFNDLVWLSLGTNLRNLRYDSSTSKATVCPYRQGDLLVEGEEWTE